MPNPKPLHPLTLVDGMWAGEPCAVLGGGPNLATIDVASVVDSMHTIAANVSARWNPDITYCVDTKVPRIIDKHTEWNPGLRLVMCHGTRERNLRQNYQQQWYHFGGLPQSEWSQSISEGIGHSGGCGFYCYNLAALLGADPIYLLGFDCDWTVPREDSHWHNVYRSSPGVLEKFYDVFSAHVPDDVRKKTFVLEPTRLSELGYSSITAEAVGYECRELLGEQASGE